MIATITISVSKCNGADLYCKASSHILSIWLRQEMWVDDLSSLNSTSEKSGCVKFVTIVAIVNCWQCHRLPLIFWKNSNFMSVRNNYYICFDILTAFGSRGTCDNNHAISAVINCKTKCLLFYASKQCYIWKFTFQYFFRM